MALIAPTIPVIGATNAVGDPQIRAALVTITDAINGGLDVANLPTMLRSLETGLRVVRGVVSPGLASGTALVTAGGGFSVVRLAATASPVLGAGVRVTFSVAFAVVPIVTVLAYSVTPPPTFGAASPYVRSASTTSFEVRDIGDDKVSFLAVGP